MTQHKNISTSNPNAFSDIYFVKATEAVTDNSIVRYQVFQRKHAILAGSHFLVEHVRHLGIPAMIRGLHDGTKINPGEPTHIIEGCFQDLVMLETEYLGVLSELTKIATNVNTVVEVANGHPVLFFPARFALPTSQFWHGYAAAVGGATGVSTTAQASGFNMWQHQSGISHHEDIEPTGTMPHAIIAACGGNTVLASLKLAEMFPDEPIWALVDFDNDCVNTTVEVFKAFEAAGMEHRLAGVRLDTSEKLIDKTLQQRPWTFEGMHGVCPELVDLVRIALNDVGAYKVKICVSGGFTPGKIIMFEAQHAHVDVYAVGEYFLSGSNPFTSDIVSMQTVSGEWTPVGKVGRTLLPEPAGFETLLDTIHTK